jgi:cytochrome c553
MCGDLGWKSCRASIALLWLGAGIGIASAQSSSPPAIVEVCAPCHGINGIGGDVEKPNLAGQKSIYIREQLLAFRSGKRRHPEMKSIARELSDREIDQLVIYYSTLSPN